MAVTNKLLERVANLLSEDATHISIGTGVEPTKDSVLLDNENNRKPCTNNIDDTTLIIEGFWDTGEANGITYTNVGCFGNGATDELNTGELFAGGAINVNKDNTQSLTVTIEITVTEGI